MIEKVLRIISSGRYNRDIPFLGSRIKERISCFIQNNAPIKLVGFWGVGFKNYPGDPENSTIKFLQEMNKKVKEIYQHGIDYTFIIADQHAILNKIHNSVIESYSKGIEELFIRNGFKFIYLSILWEKHRVNFAQIEEIRSKLPKDWWGKIENAYLLEENAQRLLGSPYLEAAQRYYILRQLEKAILEREFKHSIFHSFCDSRLRCVLPNLPGLYLYSRKGWCDSPWFAN